MVDIWISLCLLTCVLLTLLWALRKSDFSLGLPFGYMFNLFVQHAPGAYADAMRPELFSTSEAVAIGTWQTAVASSCFLVGVLAAIPQSLNRRYLGRGRGSINAVFPRFCLFGGWFFTFALSPLGSIPSLGALISKGSDIWILGVMLSLRDSIVQYNYKRALYWTAALAVFPVVMLIFGGFLSYGEAAITIALPIVAISYRRFLIVLVTLFFIIWVGLTIFVNYYATRDDLRNILWSDASLDQRIGALSTAFSKLSFFDISNDAHALALEARLNQNYFVGLTAQRLKRGKLILLMDVRCMKVSWPLFRGLFGLRSRSQREAEQLFET